MAHGHVNIDQERCKGCALCTEACVPGVLVMAANRFNARGYRPATLLDPDGRCTGCGLCALTCPEVCLTVYRTVSAPAPAGGRLVQRPVA
jgi:2-oxoglutarate ferredoxin oxidoreductase subunit delta